MDPPTSRLLCYSLSTSLRPATVNVAGGVDGKMGNFFYYFIIIILFYY